MVRYAESCQKSLLYAAGGLFLFGLSGCGVPSAHTGGASDEIAALRATVQAQQHQLDALRRDLQLTATARPEGEDLGRVEPAAELGPPSMDLAADKTAWQPVGLAPQVEARGRLHADAVFVDQSARNKQAIGDVENATGFRRARIGAQGRVAEHVHWVAEIDFSSGSIQIIDLFVGVDKLPVVGEVRVGHLPEPLSLDALTSSRYSTFLERTGNNALDPGQNWGLALYRTAADERTTFQLGAFRSGSNAVGLDVTDQGDWALTTRATRLLWFDEAAEGRSLAHVGGAFSYRQPRDGVATFQEQPGNRLIAVGEPSDTPFLSTLSIPVRNFQQYNLEAAAVLGSLALQAEWGCAALDQTGGGFVFLQGFYVSASWFLTGEHRPYSRADGTFDRVRVRSPFFTPRCGGNWIHGPGAWELAARFDFTDFRDSDNPPAQDGVQAGSLLLQGTIGLNWYLNDYTRLMFNYIIAELHNPSFGTSQASLFSTRFALFW